MTCPRSMAALAPSEGFAQVFKQGSGAVEREHEALDNPALAGLAAEIRQMYPPDKTENVLPAFDANVRQEQAWDGFGFLKGCPVLMISAHSSSSSCADCFDPTACTFGCMRRVARAEAVEAQALLGSLKS